MITNPKTFFEQFQNFIEESGLQLKKFKSNLSNYFTKSEAIDTFLGKTDKAESAKKADEATKAIQDAKGNVIDSTYLTKNGKAASATSADTATKASQDSSGNEITTTYLKKADAESTYLGKTAKAESAKSADSATKAIQDGDGKNIANTYATIASLTTTNTNVTNAQTTANNAKTLAEAKVALSGNRGQLAGYETSGTATTINADSPDSNQVSTKVTVANGSAGTAWTKVIRLTAAVTVTLGSAWQWAGGEVPETSAGGVIVLCWCGDGGVANFVSVSA